MRRQGGQYIDPSVASQMQQQQQQQQYSNYVAGNAYPAAPDPLRPGDAYNYAASSRPSDGQHWNWDPNTAKDPNQISSYPTGYAEGQAPHLGQQNQANAEPKAQTPSTNNSNKLQAGYGDNNNSVSIPQTIEGLEQKFLQDITKLSKEHNEAEDAEITRHRERLNEISTQYHEKLAAIRAHHLKQREELMKNEAQSRYQQYQQYNQQYQTNHSPNPPPLISGPHPSYPPEYGVDAQQRTATFPGGGYGAELAQQTAGYLPGGYSVEAKQQTAGYQGGYGAEVQPRAPYPAPAGHYESGAYGYESRGQYPGGRAYNAGGRQF